MALGELWRQANCQGLWHLSNVNDDSGNSYNLTNNGTVTFPDGKFGKAALMNGSSQYLSIADASCPNLEITGSQTWGCWIKLANVGKFQFAMSKQDGASSAKSLYVTNSNTVNFNLDGLTTNQNVTSTATVAANTWYFICGVYDSATTSLSVWVNMTKKTVTASGSTADTNYEFKIGARKIASVDSYLDGYIDEVFVFNKAMSDQEIRRYYANATGKLN